MAYEIKLPIFEGPLDLLLFLIKKSEIDIYDIPIARITKEYLNYIEMLRTLNLELAGDFILMAGTLMRIKTAMLLPAPPSTGDDEDAPEDPRQKLVQSLLEYQQFKEVAEELGGIEFVTLGPEADVEAGGIEHRQGSDPALAGDQPVPEMVHTAPQRGDGPQATDYDTSVGHRSQRPFETG